MMMEKGTLKKNIFNRKWLPNLFVLVPLLLVCLVGNGQQNQEDDTLAFHFTSTWNSEKTAACCSQARAAFEAQVNESLKNFALWKRPLVRAQYDSMHFYCPVYSPYVTTDRRQAAKQYTLFIANAKKLKNPWGKIQAVLKLAYETVRDGEYNTELDKTLLTGKEKYIAYSMDKLAGVCSEYASFTASVLRDLGIHAGTINFSTTDSTGNFVGLHTTAGVVLNDKVYILDPMFCTYYVNEKAEPLDFIAIYNLIRQKRNSDIKTFPIQHGPGESLEERQGCVTENTGKRFQVDSIMDRVQDFHEVEFVDPLLFSIQKEKIFQDNGYLINYYSVFGLPSNMFEGDETFVASAQKSYMLIEKNKR